MNIVAAKVPTKMRQDIDAATERGLSRSEVLRMALALGLRSLATMDDREIDGLRDEVALTIDRGRR